MNGYETEELRASQIKALLLELAGYERLGDEEKAAAVRRSLRAFGHKAASPEKRAEKRPAAAKPATR